jgi:hypothetical protein
MRQRTREEWEALREYCDRRYERSCDHLELEYKHGTRAGQRAAKDWNFFWYGVLERVEDQIRECERRMATTTQEVGDGD